jgi:hypothetical protein
MVLEALIEGPLNKVSWVTFGGIFDRLLVMFQMAAGG